MNVTICTDIAEDLSLHAAGEPAPHVNAHLAVCAACRERHAELRALCAALHGLRAVEADGQIVRFDFRRALWPLAIAASVLVALWPSAPVPRPIEPEPPTWFAYQRAAEQGDEALDALLRQHADLVNARLSFSATTPLSPFASLTIQP